MKAYKRTFLPKQESIETHQVPKWFHEAKLGIFIHWGLYSVPAYAPPTCELGEIEPDLRWFSNNPYAEWYMNSVRIAQGPTYEHHLKTYGEDFDYNDFAKDFTAQKFDANEWADLFQKSGAQYIIPTMKHHDGFCLWKSRYTDFNIGEMGPKRELMDELCQAVRARQMRFGVYYSGILDWQFASTPITDLEDLYNPPNVTYAYSDYAYNQVIELIDRYQPSVLWNDIAWPHKGVGDLPMLMAYYYNHVEEGVVNDRWSGVWQDFTTKEYQQGSSDLQNKWEMCRGIGLSFGYNAVEGEEHLISARALVRLLVDTVSHNGNLLINVGPQADGRIPEAQAHRLLELGAWLEKNGEAIYGTDLWDRSKDELEQASVYYTRKADKLYLLIDCRSPQTLVLEQLPPTFSHCRALSLPSEAYQAVLSAGRLNLTLHSVPEAEHLLCFELF